ncbi:hypothetical protein AAW14_04110 [Streptomyces hygroscopicus]|uniref:hypothetical protein n=1 Tax=Streptomyces hygroscopicus TaxID=1912 RepID=UPI002240172A|nr:hypothetical protein [Streptomyces hygroscopicus]MCW7941264.1 hypothetical protein [Streptomyces hygroscopicus]
MTTQARHGGRIRTDLLGVYLNDHLAGSTIGCERAQYTVRALHGSPLGRALAPIAAEIAEDRRSLLDIMRRLGVSSHRYKVGAAWASEKAGRLKTNGRLVGRSPLSNVLELEFLRLGVEGKAAGWRLLLQLADDDGRLDRHNLEELFERAQRQLRTLEELRLQESRQVFRAVDR